LTVPPMTRLVFSDHEGAGHDNGFGGLEEGRWRHHNKNKKSTASHQRRFHKARSDEKKEGGW